MDKTIKDWCYAECERQHATTERDIHNMLVAWFYASLMNEDEAMEIMDIRALGKYVDPIANPEGRFRTGPAVFMNGGSSAPAHEIQSRLFGLIGMLNAGHLTDDVFYQELMWIHPFKDGNGRVGALVYNVLNGTIDNPVVPPEYR